ncbi:MAG: phage virion morphogenesis protein [Candidatus Kapaibacterium sp.]
MIIHSDKFITDIQKRLQDLLVLTPDEKRQLYLAQGEILQSSIARQFQTLGNRYLGHTWAPLAESTKKAYKRKRYDLKPTLNRTGSSGLFGSIQTTVDNDGPKLGSNKEYAKWVMLGTRHMSPRPFLPMPPFARTLIPDDIQRIRNITIKAYENKIRRLT